MKGLTLAAGIGTLMLPVSAAQAGVLTLGDGYARSCYESSVSENATPAAIATCDLAFAEQALDARDQVATHVNRGIIYYLSGNLRAANSDYDQALAMNPNEPEAWLNKGLSALKGGDSATAVAMFEKALELRTTRPALAYYGRAIANEDRGDLHQAYADLRRAHDLEPRWSLPGEELKRYVVR
jgi:tetratricopeptide (TPR) repeat protein